MLPTHDELVDDLVRVVDLRLLDPLDVLLGAEGSPRTLADLRATVRAHADGWARALLESDGRAATTVVARLIAALYPGDAAFDPPDEWWRRPLGRVVAHRVGHPGAESISYRVAGAMLGITRQGVHDLVNRGRLRRHPDGGVLPESVRTRLRQLTGTRPEGKVNDG